MLSAIVAIADNKQGGHKISYAPARAIIEQIDQNKGRTNGKKTKRKEWKQTNTTEHPRFMGG